MPKDGISLSRGSLAGHFQTDADSRERLLLDLQKCIAPGEIVTDQVAREIEPRLGRIDLFAQFMAVERHAGLKPQRVARSKSGRRQPVGFAQFHDGVPDTLGHVGADAQLEAVFARVAGFG